MSKIYRTVDNEIVIGRSLSVLVKDGDSLYILTDLEVYADGTIICWNMGDELLWDRRGMPLKTKMSFDELERVVTLGKFVTTIPEGASIRVPGLATFIVSKIEGLLEQEDLIGVVRDTLHELNGEPTSSDQCLEAFFRFLDEPTQLNHERLSEAYQAVPSHWRIFVLKDFDNGNAAIAAILVREVDAIDRGWLDEQKQWYEYLRERR